ncbi:MAG TPA: pyruvate kinase [Ilumatobacteraceae bacterium]|nr:pyruvate kinase [Ilumatobacteraceae bacterium]
MTLGQQLDEIDALADEVRQLRAAMLRAEEAERVRIDETHERHRRSAINLVHYVELRHHDIRTLQNRLSALGLSSLGRSESHVMATVDSVLAVLARLAGRSYVVDHDDVVGITEGDLILAANASDLLGPQAPGRIARIMVTLPSDAAERPDLIDSMVKYGMDVARINCAHDDADAWAQMIGHIRHRSDDDAILIAMDLGGPKLRTKSLTAGPAVIRTKPKRDAFGRVVTRASIRLTGSDRASTTVAPTMQVDDAAWLTRRVPGDLVKLIDARGSHRSWTVMETSDAGCELSCAKTTYFTNGTELSCPNDHDDDPVRIVGIEPTRPVTRIDHGDRIVLTRGMSAPPRNHADNATVVMSCTLPELFDAARVGEPIWFDDGKIGGYIDHVESDHLVVVVDDVRPGGANLRSGKGINVPDTDLAIEALTDKDLEDLPFVAAHADIVNLSFVREVADVGRLQGELRRLDAAHLGIVLKIENARAFENLPALLLAAMASERVGVMIARGDLAVEVGFERLAEVQEEIMWVCEAAHVPVIWATQVLERMALTGRPSRAEVTDAAMSVRAECVMLNKGPHILEAMEALDSILSRMGGHQRKKRSMLRRLTAWDRLDDE